MFTRKETEENFWNERLTSPKYISITFVLLNLPFNARHVVNPESSYEFWMSLFLGLAYLSVLALILPSMFD